MSASFCDHRLAHSRLGALVGSVWSLAHDATTAELPGLIAPDAQVEFVFQLGDPAGLDGGQRFTTTPRAMLYALRHGTLRMVPAGANSILAFRLAPAVAAAVLRHDLSCCWDRPVPLGELIGSEAERLLDRLAAAQREAWGDVVEHWLLARLADWDGDDDRDLALQRRLFRQVTSKPVSGIADELGVTARTLRRRCARSGLSAKQLVMSGRMLRGCALLHYRRELPIAEVADRLGFSDQAAFGNAFRQYVGMTPAQLRAEPVLFCEPI